MFRTSFSIGINSVPSPYDYFADIISRSELVCHAYVLRKNRNRTEDDGRLKTGKKVDGLFHELRDRKVEYGVIESARVLTAGDASSKWLSDKGKLRKTMRDIMGRLAINTRHESRVLAELEVIGVSTAGLDVQLLRLTQPGGYVCLLHNDMPQSVPPHIAQFPQLVFVLALILKAKVCSQNRQLRIMIDGWTNITLSWS